jgi:hypothetical protein
VLLRVGLVLLLLQGSCRFTVHCVHPYGYDGFQAVERNQQQQASNESRIRGNARTRRANMAPLCEICLAPKG